MKTVTEKQLQHLKRISPDDKQLIEKTVGLLDPDRDKANVLRGYLVQLFDELTPDDELRADLDKYASAWCDGFEDGKKTILKWIRKFELTNYSDLKNNEYDCYLVRKSEVDKLEKHELKEQIHG